jgi:capsular exopolysaccharide synthesis family protein
MSRVFDALRQSEQQRTGNTEQAEALSSEAPDLLRGMEDQSVGIGSMEMLHPHPQPSGRIVCNSPELTLGAEKFRLLAIRLKLMNESKPIQAIVVTSSIAEEGKSCTSVNLAFTLARSTGQKVLLVEGDLRRPVQSENLGIPQKPGLTEYLRSKDKASQFIYKIDELPLWFMPAGFCDENAADLLQTARAPELITRLRSWFDWIIIDAPPLLPLADANIWSRLADGILLVVRQGKTPKRMLREGLESLHDANILGIVFNDSTGKDAPYYANYAYTNARRKEPAGNNGAGD